jgi:hypothetical protein
MHHRLPDEHEDAAPFRTGWRRAVTETRHVLAQADAAWARHTCPATAECCQLTVTKREPWLWPSEWRLILEHLRRARRPLPPPRPDGACPFLDAAGTRCTVYEARPFGCRTFFCHRITGPKAQPGQRTHALLDRLAALNVAVQPDAAPRALLAWHRDSP